MTTTVKVKKPPTSRDNVESAWRGLSAQDHIRLKRIAQVRAFGLPDMEWQDLVQEAVTRTLSGSRKWPSDVPFLAFLAQTMRSIANEQWLLRNRRNEVSQSDFSEGEKQESAIFGYLDSVAVDHISPERQLLATRAITDLENYFAEDAEALLLLRGIAEGSTPVELQQAYGLTKTKYESAQKRIRRKIAKGID